MKKTDTLQGSLDLLVLKVLSRRPKLHGYVITAASRTALTTSFLLKKAHSIQPYIAWMNLACSAPSGPSMNPVAAPTFTNSPPSVQNNSPTKKPAGASSPLPSTAF
jgi:hypothetical protein